MKTIKGTIRNILVMLIIMMVVINTSFAVGTKSFSDVSGHWGESNISRLVGLEIIDGYTDGTFKPNNPIKVDEFLKLVVTALGHFPDKSNTGYWASNYIAKAKELNLISAVEFPNTQRYINREEMSSIIVKAFKIENFVDMDSKKTFIIDSMNDYNTITDKYKDAVLEAYGVGLIKGKPLNMFDPKGLATRAEASTIIIRMLDETQRTEFVVVELPKRFTEREVWDDTLGWIIEKTEFFAPTNLKGEVVTEVMDFYDICEAAEKNEANGYWSINNYSPFSKQISNYFYPSQEASEAWDKAKYVGMLYTAQFERFSIGTPPYTLNIFETAIDHTNPSWEYVYEQYGKFLDDFFNFYFENDSTIAMEKFAAFINKVSKDIYKEENYTFNGRDVFFGSKKSAGIWFSEKQ